MDAKNTFAYGLSRLWILPEGTTKDQWPTEIDDDLPAGSLDVGLTTTDGESVTKTVETTTLDANQQAAVRQFGTNGSLTIDFTCLEDNEVVRFLWNAVQPQAGDNYVDVTDMAASVTRTIVYETSDTQEGYVKHKTYVGVANIVPNGSRTYSRGSAVSTPFQATLLGGYREIFEPDAS